MALSPAHVAALRCPVCHGALGIDGPRLSCADGHTSDLARQGYVHLSGLHVSHPGDSADMLDARKRVQEAGLHGTITDAVDRAVGELADGLIIEIGAGTAHHLAALLDRRGGAIGLALDSSTYAARRAARAHDRVGALVADVVDQLPVMDGAADVCLSIFSPRPADEIVRMLGPGGRLVIAHALPGHLAPLVNDLGLLSVGDDKAQRIDDALPLELLGAEVISTEVAADAEAVIDLVQMGPNAFHQDPAALDQRVQALTTPLTITLHVRVAVYGRLSARPRAGDGGAAAPPHRTAPASRRR